MSAENAEAAPAYGIRDGHRLLSMTFFGREPLIEESVVREAWPRLNGIAGAHGITLTAKIPPNGALLTPDFARFVRDGGIFVSVSIDGDPASQDTGRPTVDGSATSADATRALEMLVRERTPFSTYSVVTPANAELCGRSPEECGDCAIRERCASNCACLNLRTAGSMRNVDELLCAHERIVTLTTDRLAARPFRKRDKRFLDRHYNPYSDPLRVVESIFRETSS